MQQKVRKIVQVPDGPNVTVAEARAVFRQIKLDREARALEKKAQARRKRAGKNR